MTARTIQAIESVYDARAAFPVDGNSYREDVRRDIALLRRSGVRPADFVCDVGCGIGWHLAALYGLGYRQLYGIDLSAASLQAFRKRSQAARNGKICLLHGDVCTWHTREFFDVVTSFLCCLGAFSPAGDRRYLRSLRQITRPGGLIVFSCFAKEEAQTLQGQTRVRYSDSSAVTIESAVRFNRRSSDLIISQTSSAGGRVPDERIRLYSVAGVAALAQSSGIQIEQVLPPIAKVNEPSARLTIVGRAG